MSKVTTLVKESPVFQASAVWSDLTRDIKLSGGEALTWNAPCDLAIIDLIKLIDDSAVFPDVSKVSYTCVQALVEAAAADPAVIKIRVDETPAILNFDTPGFVQIENPDYRPYSGLGLNGTGQIAAVMDTGLDDLSCFFAEPVCNQGSAECLIPRDRKLYTARRKVIQYVDYADKSDYEAGHGTHVSGTVAGSAIACSGLSGQFTGANGIAPGAKLIMQDVGDDVGNLVALNTLSLYSTAFPSAFTAGARVHTNSWGTYATIYDSFARDVDRYTYENPDFLVLVAAGNSGSIENVPMVGSPATAKNALSVGSGIMRDVYSDVLFRDYTVSAFSSTGPTPGGVIKPDIVAPGSNIVSARANHADYFTKAVAGNIQMSCTTEQMSGTSMATPLTAGTALLVRQYFMDSAFWAKYCDSQYSTCVDGSFTPTGYMIKAVILHSGQEMQRYSDPNEQQELLLGRVPDVFQGYGLIRLSNVLPAPGLGQSFRLYVHDRLRLAQGNRYCWNVVVAGNEINEPLKVTIAWYDFWNNLGIGNLLHNLDLTLTAPDGTVYEGNHDDAGDDKNPNEQVIVTSPSCYLGDCTFVVEVKAVTITQSTQAFAIVITTSGTVSEPFHSSISTSAFPGSSRVHHQSLLGSLLKSAKPLSEDRPVEERTSSAAGAIEYEINIGKFSILAVAGTYQSTWSMQTTQRLSTVVLQFFDWTRSDLCPSDVRIRLTDPSGRTYDVLDWPKRFRSCRGLSPAPAYALGYYSHRVGLDLLSQPLSGSGTWSIRVSLASTASNNTLYYMNLKLILKLDSTNKVRTFRAFSYNQFSLNRVSSALGVVSISGLEECTVMSYVTVSIQFVANACGPRDLTIGITDASSRAVHVLQTNRFTWSSTAAGTYVAQEYVLNASLNGTGVYSVTFTNKGSCIMTITPSLNFVYQSQDSCPSKTSLGSTKLIDFDITYSACKVDYPNYIGDGYCDFNAARYNEAVCDFDGGDCCENTCLTGSEECNSNGYSCSDTDPLNKYFVVLNQFPGAGIGIPFFWKQNAFIFNNMY
jgi:subtilisin family serine protease